MLTFYKVTCVIADFESMQNNELESVYTYKSLEEIEKDVIPKLVDDTKELCGFKLHHINVVKIPMDRIVMDFETVSERVYWPDGKLYMSKDYRNLFGDQCFPGRDETPLKVGDKVYWFGGNGHIYKGVVYMLPPKVGDFEYLDSADDSYVILEDMDEIPDEVSDGLYMERHQHIDVGLVFKRD